MSNPDLLQFIERYSAEAGRVAASLVPRAEQILELVDLLYACAKQGGRILTCGNGGSACDAMHMAEELVARYLKERPGIRAQHLIDSGTMTCWANDYSFETIFSRQVETLMDKQDVLMAFTTSGNSPNVLRAVEAAKKIGGTSIALSGKGGGKIKELADHCLVVDSDLTSHIQEAHMMLVHLLCDLLEQRLFPECT